MLTLSIYKRIKVMKTQIKLSILDQSPINKGKTTTEALQETTELAILSDRLGYTRFWVSEHHNTSSLAGVSPEVLIAHLASHTQNIRIGSGGIMLPNHSSLKMAENFKLLEALYPRRIDMGIGRAPGTDRYTASLLNPSNTFNEQDFINQLYDLIGYFHNTNSRVKVLPQLETIPDIWLLTSSGESSFIAAHMGVGMSYAQFINPMNGNLIIEEYKNNFEPSVDLHKPQTNVALFVFCNEDQAIVDKEQALIDFRFIQLERGGNLTSVGYDDIKNMQYSDFEKQRIRINRNRTLYGTPDVVEKKLSDMARHYNIDEIMTITYAEQFEHRLHSYELLASMFNLNQ